MRSRPARIPSQLTRYMADFRDHVAAEADQFTDDTGKRRTPRDLRRLAEQLLALVEVPIELTQTVVVAAAYRWPLRVESTRAQAFAGTASFLSSLGGQSVTYASALTATTGSFAIATISEMADLYGVASARTLAYQRAQIFPGAVTVAADVAQIVGARKPLVTGTVRNVGDEYVSHLLGLLEHSIADRFVVPFVGPLHSAVRSYGNVGRAWTTPLTRVPADEQNRVPMPVDESRLDFAELLRFYEQHRGLPRGFADEPHELG